VRPLGDLEYPWDFERNEHLFSYHPESIMLVKMKPQYFMDIASSILEFGNEYDESVLFLKDAIQSGEPMEVPYLEVQRDTWNGKKYCHVVNHEGRHRMTAAKQLGIDEVPVVIYFFEKPSRAKFSEFSEVSDQGCFSCGPEDGAEDVCKGVVRSQTKIKKFEEVVDDKTYIRFKDARGPLQMLHFKRMPIDWCKIPSVRDAPKRWLKGKGIVLDCD